MRTEPTDEETAQPTIERVTSLVRSLGLDVSEPEVLGVGANVVLHLRPTPVVARIATLTAEMRGNAADYLRRERDICAALDKAGHNVTTPTDIIDPGPHTTGAVVFLLLKYRELEPVDLTSPEHAVAAGTAFADMSQALAELPVGLGQGDEGHPWPEMARLQQIAEATTEPAAQQQIAAVITRLKASEPDDPWQLVHGDAHKGNVAFSEGQIIWFDFEDANLRPLAWDLASLRRAWPAAGDVACQQLGVDPESPTMRWHHELREVYALLWNILYSQRFVRAQEASAERLTNWLAANPIG